MAEDKQQVTNLDLDSVSNKFVGIPIADLVAAPLLTVCAVFCIIILGLLNGLSTITYLNFPS